MAISSIEDLDVRLIVNETPTRFFTSDNPVIKYNQYCEGVQGLTTTGMLSQGLQLFLPVSAKHLIILYDKNAYAVRGHGNPVITTKCSGDVEALNLLQAINADEILLFSDWAERSSIEETIGRASRHRKFRHPKVVELVADDDPRHRTLLHLHWMNVNINSNL
jgi:hypothetical protein